MKALTLHQPWAGLIAAGLKTIETRSWSTNYRGPLAIHAGLQSTKAKYHDPVWASCVDAPGSALLRPELRPLSFGAVVATCTLADVVPTKAVTWVPDDKIGGGRHWGVGDQCAAVVEAERAYGDFASGRYAWLLNDIVPLAEPVSARGRQGLWMWAGIADTETPPGGER